MAEFKVNADMFGMYARIPTGYSKEMHVYKVVSKFKSNIYCDVPIVYNSKPVIHDKEFSQLSDLEDVLNVIHCGIDETKVIRVALKDCEIVKPTADVVEVETVEAWLYEMAINNVGCDGDFSNACEEIIARLDGLRNFAKERSDT